jgi:hypothetical protein
MNQVPMQIVTASTPPVPDGAPRPLTQADHAALDRAVTLLEQMSFATRLTALFGHQIELVGRMVPARFASMTARAANLALKAALRTAFRTMRTVTPGSSHTPSPGLHRALAMASGAAGGAFGFASLPFELPVSTTIMLRSIADIARSEGEDLTSPETALACLQVFALGGRPGGEEAILEGGYFAVRGVFARTLTEATRYVLERGAAEEGAPIIMRLLSLIATRFGAVVSQKAMAQAIPVLGAASGAAVNYAFMQHFQDVARGHFTVRRLERDYGAAAIRDAYDQIRLARAGNSARPI